MTTTREAVEARLAEEAARFNAEHRGTHRYSAIWETDAGAACNWSANFTAVGSRLSLSGMRAATERVQAELPVVGFGTG
jgi:hypothetical protein